jgi:hypothetical protein
MRYCLVLYILICTYTVSAQTARDTIFFSLSIGIDRIAQRKELLKLYSDSIANYKGGALPVFMLDVCLDWNASLWESLHSPVSIRWKILSEVTDKKALELLLQTHKKQLKKVCPRRGENVYPFLKVPMIEKSFYELIKKRCAQL